MGAAAFDIGAVFICLTSLVYMIICGHYKKFQSKVLLIIIVDVAITAASNAAAALIRTYAVASAASHTAIEVVGFIYFVTHTALAPLFVLYVLAVCRVSTGNSIARNIVPGVPFIAAELLVLTNPITHWVYTYGPDLSFWRDWGIYALYIIGTLYLVVGFVKLVYRWRALTRMKRRALVYFFLMAAAGIMVQLLIPVLRVELFAESLAVLGVIMFVENEDDVIDSETGVYNRQALRLDLATYSSRGKPFYLIVVRVTNIDALNRLGRKVHTEGSLIVSLADYFKSIVEWHCVYRTAPTRFVLVDPNLDKVQAAELAKKISDQLGKGWKFGGIEVALHAVVALACVPDDMPTTDDVFYLLDTPMPHAPDGTVLQGEGLNYLVRRAGVERAVQRGFDEDNYEVYFQPIVRADGSMHEAEALMRLNDSELGGVPPIEFIEVAERLGCVDRIGDFALRQACAFLQSGEPQRLGIDEINVNLSVIECMQTDFVDRVRRAVAESGVDAHRIGFEITESVASGDYDFLGRVMERLKRDGHKFSMDDFGTGYSNMHSLQTLDFDIVKIDKSVLWDAEKSSTGMAVLENSVRLLRNTGCKILVEGVETASQLELLQRFGVDYYQGYYFAKPMPKDEFVAFIAQHRV